MVVFVLLVFKGFTLSVAFSDVRLLEKLEDNWNMSPLQLHAQIDILYNLTKDQNLAHTILTVIIFAVSF
jgi:hypothetical protein